LKIKFEKYLPGYLPEIPTNDVYIKKIIVILEQFIEIYYEFQDKSNLLSINDGKIQTRKFVNNEWITKKENIDENSLFDILEINPFEIRRLIKDFTKVSNTWEIDMFYSPNIVNDNTDLYYPIVFIIADLDETRIIQYTLIDHRNENILDKYFDFIYSTFNIDGVYPTKIIMKCNKLFNGLESIFKSMKIRTEFTDYLEVINDFKEDMYVDESNYDIKILEEKLLSLLESGEITEEDIDDDFINELLKNLDLNE